MERRIDAGTGPNLEELLERLASPEQRVREMEENRWLRDQLDEAQRAATRRSAPFRRRESKKIPDGQKKRPSRPEGHKGAYRIMPQQINETAEVPLAGCPSCGGTLTDVTPVAQFIDEFPVIRPYVTRLVTYQGSCAVCSSNPLQTSTASGAVEVQLGPRARALAISLYQQFGLMMRGVCRVLDCLVGLKLSPGGRALAIQRTAERVQLSLDQLIYDIRASAVVFVDETSWYVGAPEHWLCAFTTADSTVNHIDLSRGRDVVLEMMGPSFDGILVSDCLASYEDRSYRTHKCIARHQKAISEARARPDTIDPSHLDQ